MNESVMIRFIVAYKPNCDDEDIIKKYPHIHVIKDFYDMILDCDVGDMTQTALRFKDIGSLDGMRFSDGLYKELCGYIENDYVIAVKIVDIDDNDLIDLIRNVGSDNETFIIVEEVML